MTNTEIIQAIKSEIEKEYNESHEKKIFAHKDKDYYNETAYGVVMGACNRFLSFLSTLESEKPMQEGLEEEIERYLPKIPENPYNEELRVFARYFFNLGLNAKEEKTDNKYGIQL